MGRSLGRSLAAALACGLAATAAAQPAPVEASDRAESGWVAFAQSDAGLIFVRLTIDGRPVDALLDTGAPYSLIDRGWAERNGLVATPHGARVPALGGGAMEVDAAAFRTLELAGSRQAGGRIGVADLSPLAAAAGRPVEAVVGSDMLSPNAVQIDFDARRLRLMPSGAAPPPGRAAPLRLREHGLRYETDVTVEGRTLSPMLIDTGDDGSLAITRGTLDPLPAGLRVTDVAAMGGGGLFTEEYARLDGVGIGGLSVDAVPVSFCAPLGQGDAGRVGMELLNRFNLFMDPRRGVLVMSPRLEPPPPAPVSLSGVQGLPTATGLAVVHVMRGSPARAAGLRAGDRICAVDGVPLAGEAVRAALRGTAGRTVALGLCDGRDMRLTLTDFY